MVEEFFIGEVFYNSLFWDTEWKKMDRRSIAYLLLITGVVFLGVHTTLAVLWQLSTGSPETYPLSSTTLLYYGQGFTSLLGVVCLLAAGLVYEKSEITS
jgi:hypothetical protein